MTVLLESILFAVVRPMTVTYVGADLLRVVRTTSVMPNAIAAAMSPAAVWSTQG